MKINVQNPCLKLSFYDFKHIFLSSFIFPSLLDHYERKKQPSIRLGSKQSLLCIVRCHAVIEYPRVSNDYADEVKMSEIRYQCMQHT